MKLPEHLQREAFENKAFHELIAVLWKEFQRIIDFLEKNYGIRPLLVGGLAVQYYGYARMTEDIDILLSKADYQKLIDDNKIKYGSLRFKSGMQVDVLCEGKDNNPNPEHVRGQDYFPSFEGLIYMKLLAGRMKDLGDVAELVKINGMTNLMYEKIKNFLPANLHEKFDMVWDNAREESKRRN